MFGRRLNLVYLALCAALLVLCAKIFILQVLRISLEDPGIVLHPPKPWQRIPAARGAVLDRNGIILAADRPQLDLAIRYDRLRYPKYWLRALQQATGMSEEELLDARARIRRRVRLIRGEVLERNPRIRRKLRAGKMRGWKIYEETIPHTVVADVSLQTAARVQASPERFPGVTVETRLRRECPDGSMARLIVGLLSKVPPLQAGQTIEDPRISPGDRIGVSGIEKQYDRVLRGMPGLFREEVIRIKGAGIGLDPLLGGITGAARKELERRSGTRTRIVPLAVEHGSSIRLTLDRNAQLRATLALADRKGAVVVMDVRNGELLVLASTPLEDYLSRAIQDPIPCGSVIKPIVALAAGEEGLNMSVNCAGSIRIGGRTYQCSHSHGATRMKKGIAESCNIYFWRLGRRIGVPAIVKMADDLGFGKRTGVDLPFEWPGRLPTPTSPMNLCIGQGNLQVTPLQVAVAMAAIANGGKVLKPRIFLRVEPAGALEGLPEPGPALVREISFSQPTLETVRAGMRAAVAQPGGTVYSIPQLRMLKVAAKTGTAETNDPRHNHTWLAGYVPWDEPRYAFAIVVHRAPGSGAGVAGPIAAQVLDTLINRD